MSRREQERISEAENHALFDRLFRRGFAGQDVLDESAPEGWERSPLLACFHPSIERIFGERLLMHCNLEELRRMRRRRDGSTAVESSPEPTLEDVRKDYEPSPVQPDDEVTELVGLCLWDTFSDNPRGHRRGWPFRPVTIRRIYAVLSAWTQALTRCGHSPRTRVVLNGTARSR